jgi:hypothetical protein
VKPARRTDHAPDRQHGQPATPGTVPGPVIAAALWREVTAHAGNRCECRGECHRSKHTDGGGRCTRENGPLTPLHAVPHDPAVPFHAAAVLGASALHALCAPCHAAVAATRATTRRAALETLCAAETLF